MRTMVLVAGLLAIVACGGDNGGGGGGDGDGDGGSGIDAAASTGLPEAASPADLTVAEQMTLCEWIDAKTAGVVADCDGGPGVPDAVNYCDPEGSIKVCTGTVGEIESCVIAWVADPCTAGDTEACQAVDCEGIVIM